MGDKAHKCMIAPILFKDMPNAMKGEVHDAMVHLEKNSSMADFLLRGTDIRAYAPGVAQNSVHSLGTIFEAMFHHAADQHAVVVQYMDWVNTHCSKASPPAQAPPAPPAPGSNPWHCAVCSKTCNSQMQWNEHVNSDKHKSAMSASPVVKKVPSAAAKPITPLGHPCKICSQPSAGLCINMGIVLSFAFMWSIYWYMMQDTCIL